ncbi:hypothetical protein PAXINDRAFT_22239 [Paxillus involutus ATCC 200175]|uniref:Uncharacterized protein n=1 Tax=Paxillus involutus ATCC 200175 TaxID=664439 RepID=A0A0C9TB15_PAXIN|nr:hypothetical protein PAXINDRAFT_22239 [Paxillus involutus ATCC 200175]
MEANNDQPSQCGTINNVVDVLYTTCIVSAEVALALRTYALWSRNQRVLAILIGLLVVFVIAAGLVGALGKFSLPGDSESPYGESFLVSQATS